MKDDRGVELEIGDLVVCTRSGYETLSVKYVTGFTKSSVRVNDTFIVGAGFCKRPDQVAKIR